MKAEILTIGDELLRGEIIDSNKSLLSERLLSLDIETHWHSSVRDDPPQMIDAFRRAVERADVVLVSGGLGPTRDDLTAEVLAESFGRKLVLDEVALDTIRAFFQSVGREMTENNAKQARFPEGAEVLANPIGTAPGFAIEERGAAVFCLPGVPRELRRMLDEQVLPRLATRLGAGGVVVRARLLRTFGMGESTLDTELADIATGEDVSLGFRTSFPDNYLRPVARGRSAEEAEAKLAAICEAIRARLGPLVYAEGEQSLATVVGELLSGHAKTLATAESCSGGLVAQLVTEVPGASEYFLGGVVAYSNAAKHAQLGVPLELLEQHGAVSEPVARAMAEGVRQRFGAQLGVATTGISGPGGGTPSKPVGLVYLALAQDAGTHVDHFVFPLDRTRHRLLTAQVALDWVRRALLGVELAAPTLLRRQGGRFGARTGMSDARIRSFIAVELAAAARRAAFEVSQALRRSDGDVRWVRPETLHVTLRFLGDLQTSRIPALVQSVEAELAELVPFELGLGEVELFPSLRRPRVIALQLAPVAPLAALAAAVERGVVAAGCEPEPRAFRPHLTLGRVRGRLPDAVDVAAPPPSAFPVAEAVLFRSDLRPRGAKHTPLARMALAAGSP